MKKNLFDDIPSELPEEFFTLLMEQDGIKLERIVSDGHASPENFWYNQDQNEWILLIAGSAILRVGEKKVKLDVGDFLFLPAHQQHRVESTSKTEKTIWLALFWNP
jgi:cupin 2 domain-containing protein